MRLDELLEAVEVDRIDGGGDPGGVDVVAVAFDSRDVATGALFCCVPGEATDGHRWAAEAVAAGAVALVVEHPVEVSADVPQVVVASVRRTMPLLAARLAGDPSQDLTVVGVTGTNGKTTTTHLLQAVLAAAGLEAEVIGTLSGVRTTPEGPVLQATLADARARGVDAVAMEVSSHALDQHRVDGTRFSVAVFTNLSRDHLDYHASMEAYFRAKAQLFTPALADHAVVNLDDPHGRLLLDAAEVPTTGYSLDDVEDLVLGPHGSSFRWQGEPVRLDLAGRFNVANALAAATAALTLGVDEATIARGLSAGVVVPGRFERIEEGQPFTAVVDYAHTPDGLDQVLAAADELAGGGRVHVVFGCGGDRDATKRPAMGEVAARGADRVVLTADNSRGEDLRAILDQVRAGIDAVADPRAEQVVDVLDRRRAIADALAAAAPGDVVVVAGKGHETTMDVGGQVIEFDDRAVVAEELRRLGAAT